MVHEKMRDYIYTVGLKISVIEERAGLPKKTLSPILHGKRKMSVEEYIAICRAMGVDYSLFMPA